MPGLIGERMLNIFDLDKDGFLNKVEFQKAFVRLFATSFEENFKLVYDIFDFDGNGLISKEDCRIILSHVPLVRILELINVQEHPEGAYTKEGGGLYCFSYTC